MRASCFWSDDFSLVFTRERERRRCRKTKSKRLYCSGKLKNKAFWGFFFLRSLGNESNWSSETVFHACIMVYKNNLYLYRRCKMAARRSRTAITDSLKVHEIYRTISKIDKIALILIFRSFLFHKKSPKIVYCKFNDMLWWTSTQSAYCHMRV